MKRKYHELQQRAAARSVEVLSQKLGITYRIEGWSARADRAIQNDWIPVGRDPEIEHWDWQDIVRDHSGVGDWPLSLWSDDRLCAMAAAKMRNNAVVLAFLEGDPSYDCPLQPMRFGLALDAISRYARLSGKAEIRLQPINETLAKRYQNDYGFEPHPDSGSPIYFKREL